MKTFILVLTLTVLAAAQRYGTYNSGGGRPGGSFSQPGFGVVRPGGGFGNQGIGSGISQGGGGSLVFPNVRPGRPHVPSVGGVGGIHGGGVGGGLVGGGLGGGVGGIHGGGLVGGGGGGLVGGGLGGGVGGIHGGGVGSGLIGGGGTGIVGRSCSPLGCPTGEGENGVLHLGSCSSYIRPQVHYSHLGQDYHYSWCADGGQKYNWQTAQHYCTNLRGGWYSVSIESQQENRFITSVIESHRLPYIWTSGVRPVSNPYGFAWGNGSPLSYNNWGKTGQLGKPQPDNAEENNERCLAILNHFYPRDTTTWHDIHCRHVKPIICERPTRQGSYSG